MRTALFWNTYAKDLEWFHYSLKSFAKFARGWDYAICLVPNNDFYLFQQPCEDFGVTLFSEDEWPGLGFNWHQLWQCQADILFPVADIFFHMDADTVFTKPSRPEHWLRKERIIASHHTFEYLNSVNTWGSGMWKSRVDAALGGDVKLSTMIAKPYVHHRNVYAKLREQVEARHGVSFHDYVRSCENSFPQGFCEFETLGAIAQEFFADRYEWESLNKFCHPSDGRIAEGWSHGGLDYVTSDRFDGKLSARQFYRTLGL